MQASMQRLLSTFFIAIAGAAVTFVGVAHAPPAAQHASVACGLLAHVSLAPR